MSINWNNIRPVNGSLNEGFEEFVCQLARKEFIKDAYKFIRKGKPDAGVECYWILNNHDEWAWQAKFFTTSLSSTQWGEIDESIRTVLQKHSNLKKYIIAIPNDPPDARIDGQLSMQGKWDARVNTWKKLATDAGLDVEFVAWWSSDLIERLQRPENNGMTYFWFNKEEFTDKWCNEQIETAILDLGKRYTPKLNLKLNIAEIFNGISRNDKFKKQFESLFDVFFIKGSNVITENKSQKNDCESIQSHLNLLKKIFFNTTFNGVEKIPFNEMHSALDVLSSCAKNIRYYYLEEESKLTDKSRDYGYYNKYGSEISHLRDLENSIENLRQFIHGSTCVLANNPFLLLEGDAGIGKSHLLADIVSERNAEKKFSLLFLGQHFVTDEDPWTQIFKNNQIRCSVSEFLGSLNAKAQIQGSRIIIFIDAVNEGRGKYFWERNIKSFISQINRHSWLGLVLSVRTSYSDLLFPNDEISNDTIYRHTHYGFKNQEYEATKLFFDNYGIELPSIPLLNPEFQNPLFLTLFCDGLHKAGYTRIPDGFYGITSIIDFYINSVNVNISKPERFNYPNSINLVRKSVESLIQYKIEHNSEYVSFENAYLCLNKISIGYSISPGLLDELISEGVLTKNLYLNSQIQYEEGIYLAYERFEDHLTAKYLLDKNQDLDKAFCEGGDLFRFVKTENECYFNMGMIEAFSIQIPERTGKELFDFLPILKGCYPIAQAFVNSLLWRKRETKSEHLRDYINDVVFTFPGTHDLFWDTIISTASVPNTFFNAITIHDNLMSYSLPDRDAWWTRYLKGHYYEGTATYRLVDWSWNSNDKTHISDESILLSSIVLTWFHASTNRKLRDSSTKALIRLLINRIQVLIELLKLFKDVNDPYIYERLFAVAYGCSVRTSQIDKLPDLCRYIYDTIFNVEGEVYPHILLRDYARNVIEYTVSIGIVLDFDLSKIRPPYKSLFPENHPTNDEIDIKFDPLEAGHYGKEKWGATAILRSMSTEYGRGTMGYGDFGRYTFESAMREWNVDSNKLSNLAIQWIFEKYGYDTIKHGRFDEEIGSGRGRSTVPHERIGKKYQWIAFYEILARVSDNFPKYAEWNSRYKEEDEYEGPWMPYVRDIDPTMLIIKTGDFDEENAEDFWWALEKYSNWNIKNKEWLKIDDDFPQTNKLIDLVDDECCDWLLLEGHPEWAESKKIGDDKWNKPHKRIWYQIRSYVVTTEEYDNLKKWASVQNFMGRWMPESHSRYEVYSREYYWSPAYKYFNKAYYAGFESEEIYDKDSDEYIATINKTTHDFLWEEEFDESKENRISFLKPSLSLFNGLNMLCSQKEGEFLDPEGNVICFAPSVYSNTHSYLLIKKKELLGYLKENNLKIFWTVIGEKNILGGYMDTGESFDILELSGAYFLNDCDEIAGQVKMRNLD